VLQLLPLRNVYEPNKPPGMEGTDVVQDFVGLLEHPTVSQITDLEAEKVDVPAHTGLEALDVTCSSGGRNCGHGFEPFKHEDPQKKV
jgi:hypothetical protein